MRKTLVIAAFCVVAFACNSNDNKPAEDKPADTTATTTAPTANETGKYDKALEIIATSDCLTCHKVSEKNIGPAYTDVAQKYEATDANVDSLVHKIIHGGSGVWGQVPMTPHPALSVDSAREVVRYILSLRK
jgi:cytochrome c